MQVEKLDRTLDIQKFRQNFDEIDWGHPPVTKRKPKRTVKRYGPSTPAAVSGLNLLGIPRRTEPKVIRQDLLKDWLKEND